MGRDLGGVCHTLPLEACLMQAIKNFTCSSALILVEEGVVSVILPDEIL